MRGVMPLNRSENWLSPENLQETAPAPSPSLLITEDLYPSPPFARSATTLRLSLASLPSLASRFWSTDHEDFACLVEGSVSLPFSFQSSRSSYSSSSAFEA